MEAWRQFQGTRPTRRQDRTKLLDKSGLLMEAVGFSPRAALDPLPPPSPLTLGRSKDSLELIDDLLAIFIRRGCSIELLPLADSCRLSTVALSSTVQMTVDGHQPGRFRHLSPHTPPTGTKKTGSLPAGGKLTLRSSDFRFGLRLAQLTDCLSCL